MPTETDFEQPTPVVVGDNTQTEEETKMDKDILGHVLATGAQSYQALMTDIGHNGAMAHNLLRLGSARAHNELDTIESRAHSGVMSTPIASPSVQQPSA